MKYAFGQIEVIFTKRVMKIMESYRQVKADQHESGGILLGRIFSNRIVVEHVSEPSQADRSGRYFFERNVRIAQQIVDIKWKESGGEIIYLGEWHTHPESFPTPSITDKRLISNMLRDSKMEIDFLLMVIVGTKGYFVASQVRCGLLSQLSPCS